MRRRLWIGLATLVGLMVLVIAVGYALPLGHTASGRVSIDAAPEAVFQVVTDFARYPDWRSTVDGVQVDGDAGVGQRVRESGSTGEIPYHVETFEPPARLVMRIDEGLAFGGTWTYVLEPTAAGGTTVTITENGEIYNPIFRFMARFVFGYEATLNGFLADLQARFGTSF